MSNSLNKKKFWSLKTMLLITTETYLSLPWIFNVTFFVSSPLPNAKRTKQNEFGSLKLLMNMYSANAYSSKYQIEQRDAKPWKYSPGRQYPPKTVKWKGFVLLVALLNFSLEHGGIDVPSEWSSLLQISAELCLLQEILITTKQWIIRIDFVCTSQNMCELWTLPQWIASLIPFCGRVTIYEVMFPMRVVSVWRVRGWYGAVIPRTTFS